MKTETEEVGLALEVENGKDNMGKEISNREGMSGATWTKESLADLPKRGHRNNIRKPEP